MPFLYECVCVYTGDGRQVRGPTQRREAAAEHSEPLSKHIQVAADGKILHMVFKWTSVTSSRQAGRREQRLGGRRQRENGLRRRRDGLKTLPAETTEQSSGMKQRGNQRPEEEGIKRSVGREGWGP